ncbi:MAG: hypothetical protein JO316_23380 [Abitibacteriaceae bacterium]|nr:hypothetical protein [Abditibacteriaceae bacterium]MBV9868308.1 hypothetical protein [Abditibacteriaceae bacterium]
MRSWRTLATASMIIGVTVATVLSPTSAAARLYDKFDSSTNWSLVSGSGSATISSGHLTLSLPANTIAQPTATSLSSYALTGSRQSIQVVSHSGVGGKSVFFFNALISAGTNSLEMKLDDQTGGTNIVCGYYLNGTYHWVGSAAYNPATDRYLAYREASGTIYYETSPDAQNWTPVTTLSNPFTVALNVIFQLQHKVYASGAGVATSTVVDNFNYLEGGAHNNLDDDPLTAWSLYTEPPGNAISPSKTHVTDTSIPAGDSNVFDFQITSSDAYTNAYYFQRLPLVANTDFVYTLYWKFFPTPSTSPIAQAYEFPLNKYTGSLREQAALQWLPNKDGNGYRWRVWGADNGKWRDNKLSGTPYNFVQNLAANTWHPLTLNGTFKNGRVYYTTFVSDGTTFTINEDYAATTDGTAANIVPAYQIDNNSSGSHQNVYIGNWNVKWLEMQLP